MSPDHRPVSSDEMIRRAREDLAGASSTSTVTPPVPRKVDVDIADVDPDPGMVRQGPRRPAPPRPPPPSGRPRRRMPGPVATPPTGPVDLGQSSSFGVPWAVIFGLLIIVGTLVLPSSSEDASPIPTTQAVPATNPPVALPAAFRDDFAETLDPGWVWVNEVPERWSLSARDGSLRLLAPLPSATGSPVLPNLLLRPTVGASYEITTHLEFSPTANFQSAGIMVYDNALNYVQLVRAFCGVCAGDDGIYLDNVTNGGIPQSDGGHLLAARPGDVYLRLRVSGNIFLGSYSVDGSTWRSAGTITKTLLSPRIGIVAAPNDPVSPPAYFDFFETTP